jgi:hypothetical protein
VEARSLTWHEIFFLAEPQECPDSLQRLIRYMVIYICIFLFGLSFSGNESGLTIPRDVSSKITFKFLVIRV